MSNKMETSTYLSTIESKKQNNKQAEQKQNYTYREHCDGCLMGGASGGWTKKVKGLISTNRWLQNTHEEVTYSIGNGVAKGLTCMARGHEQWCGGCLRPWVGC